MRNGDAGPVLRGLADDIKRVQRRDDAPVAIWLAPDLWAGLLSEIQVPHAQEVTVPAYSPVTRQIELVPVRRLGAR